MADQQRQCSGMQVQRVNASPRITHRRVSRHSKRTRCRAVLANVTDWSCFSIASAYALDACTSFVGESQIKTPLRVKGTEINLDF